MSLLITYMFVAIAISALCSLLESVLLSTPQTYIATLNNSIVDKVSEKKDSAISAILIVNTIANTIGSSLVGIQAATIFGSVGIGIVSSLFTVLILLCSEIIPKSIGTNNYKSLIVFASIVVDKMIFIVKPLVWMVNLITRYFKNDIAITEEEIIGTVECGLEDGALTKDETNFIKNILDFKDVLAEDIMTPSTVVEHIDSTYHLTVGSVVDDFEKHVLTFSRIVVMNDNMVDGYILKDEFIHKFASDNENPINDFIRPILKFMDNRKISDILKEMIKSKEHISAIVDEYGTFRGIVTLEDIIETMLGFEIVDETDDVVDMQEYAKEKFESETVN